jgi:DNA-binding CsgD family transcriptional regulator
VVPLRAATDTPTLVGCDKELTAVREALATAPAPFGIVLSGEPGIGKTALWRAGIAEAERRRMRILVASPAESETGLSYAALGDLLAAPIDEVGDELPAPQRHALDVALLREAPDDGSVDPRAIGAGTLAVLRAAARDARVVLALDDVQWLDAASAHALAFALRRLDDVRVVLLATARGAPGGEPIDVGLSEDRLVRIDVEPLAVDALQRMLQRRLGDGLSWPTLGQLAEASGGNPYYALELGRAALREVARGGLKPELPLPEGIRAVLRDRLRALPRETTQALGTIAAMGRATIASAVSVVDPEALNAAFVAEVIREDGDAVRFEHPLLAETAYRMLSPPQRRAVHERLAEAAAGSEERARHLAAASKAPDAQVAAAIAEGAEAAATRGAPAAAAELLEASAGVEADPELRARRLIEAARHHAAAGAGRRSIAIASSLIEELPRGTLRARALVMSTVNEGSVERMLAFARQAAEEAADDLELHVEALLGETLALALSDRYDDALITAARANELCGPGSERTLRVKARTAYGRVLLLRGDAGATELLREAAQLEGDDLIPSAYWGPGTLLGRALMYAGELDAARPLFEQRRRRAIEVGDDDSRAGLCMHLAELEILAGNLELATRYAEEGLAINLASYGDQAQGALMYVRALAAAHAGDVELARDLGQRSLAQSELQGEVTFAAMARGTLGFLELSLGDHAAAAEWLSPIAERFRASPEVDPGMPHVAAVPDAVEALAAVGRLEEAESVLSVWEARGERLARSRVRASAARCRALIAAARADLDAALELAAAALEHQHGLPLRLERARTLIVLGSIQRRTKQKAAARASLDEAIGTLETIGARLWADRARAEHSRIGGRARSGGLTPSEERVAALVAEGRSNKEVAEALFVTVRTVEANLTRIYAKLGVRSRTELASRRAH